MVAEVIPYWLPFRREYVTARGRLERRQMVLLRLVDEEGCEGWGEAVPLSLRGGADLARVTGDLGSWSNRMLGRSDTPSGSHSSPTELEGLSAPARCAVLTALADLEAQRLGQPLWQLLGAKRVEPVPCNATLVSGSADAVAADAERWAADGFTTFKLKVGLIAAGPVGEADPDLAQVAAVRAAVGEDARLRLDANGAWTVARAEAVLRAAAGLGIELVEQPVASLAEMAELRRRLKIPIAADESVSSAEEAESARSAGACDLATVKLSKTGQLQPDLGGALPFFLSSALDGPVGIAAAAHACQAMADEDRVRLSKNSGAAVKPIAHGLATQRLFSSTIASQECELRGPFLLPPDGPGLGVEIDPAALDAHRL